MVKTMKSKTITKTAHSEVKKVAPRRKSTKTTFEQIKVRAYQIYVENGHKGSEIENWLKAEQELRNSLN